MSEGYNISASGYILYFSAISWLLCMLFAPSVYFDCLIFYQW